MTRDQALVIWGILAAAAPGQALSDDQLQIRAMLIEDLDAGVAREAAVRLAQSANWVPSVAEFREAVVGDEVPSPDEIWGEILCLVRSEGWVSPPCEHQCSPPAWRVIQNFGWASICEGREVDVRAHILKVAAPAAIERYRRDLLAGPTVRPAIEGPGGRTIELPDLRIDRGLEP